MADVFIEEAGRRARISLSPTLHEGAAGTIHTVVGRPGVIAKLYKEPFDRRLYEKKLRLMLAAPPNLPDLTSGPHSRVQIAWPTHLITDASGRFLGFLMPEVDFGASSMLENALIKGARKAEHVPEFYGFRLLLAANLAALMAELHEVGHYMVDMKPENMRFYPTDGYMAIVDTDGFSIAGPSDRVPSVQFSDSYIAPEALHAKPEALGLGQDLFALAVIVFRLMNNGVHPYQGVNRSNQTLPSSQQDRIFAGLYAYGLHPNPKVGPSPASLCDFFEADTRRLFDRAFESVGSRPTASEWRDHLKDLMSPARLIRCKVKPLEHAHFSKGCGLCAQEKGIVRMANAARVVAGRRVRPPPSTYWRPPRVTTPQYRHRFGVRGAGPQLQNLGVLGWVWRLLWRTFRQVIAFVIVGAMVIGVFQGCFNDNRPGRTRGSDNEEASINTPPPPQVEPIHASPFSAPDRFETVPPVAIDHALTVEEMRYCLFTQERLAIVARLLKAGDRTETTLGYFEDYNSRCRDAVYEPAWVTAISNEITVDRDRIEQEARALARPYLGRNR